MEENIHFPQEIVNSIEENVNTSLSALKEPYNEPKPYIEYFNTKYINDSVSFWYADDSNDIVYKIKNTEY